MIYVRGTSLWHVARSGLRTTQCGRRIPNIVRFTTKIPKPFLCRSCQAIIARSEVAA